MKNETPASLSGADYSACVEAWQEYARIHHCRDSGDKWAAFGDGFDRGVAFARVSEPSRPIEEKLGATPLVVLGMVPIADPVTSETIYREATDEEKRSDAERRKPATEHEVACYQAGWCAREKRFATEPPQPASVGGVTRAERDVLLAAEAWQHSDTFSHRRTEEEKALDVSVSVLQDARRREPAEPPHPTNEELIVTVREGLHWPHSALPSALNALSELERRLAAK